MSIAAKRGWVRATGTGAQRFGAQTGVVPLVASEGFAVALTEGELSGRPAQGELSALWTLLAEELSRYPEGFLESAGLRYVLLCSDLAQAGQAIASLPNMESTLLLDVGTSRDFTRRLVHHEVFHFIDFADDHILKEDRHWQALNDRYFTYGNGGRFERAPSVSRLGSGRPGFFTEYSMAALEEDKAEVFSFMMSAPDAVSKLAKEDTVLSAKLEAIARQVEAFSPSASPLLGVFVL